MDQMREARCAAYVKALQDAYGILQAHREALAIICDTLAVPDLAAARLLAAGAFRDAFDAYNDHIEECNDCCCYDPCEAGDRLRLALGEAEDACREAKEAEEAPDGQDA